MVRPVFTCPFTQSGDALHIGDLVVAHSDLARPLDLVAPFPPWPVSGRDVALRRLRCVGVHPRGAPHQPGQHGLALLLICLEPAEGMHVARSVRALAMQ